jgi:protein-S-isoprenylcysteine O-methyltransferase Ste14
MYSAMVIAFFSIALLLGSRAGLYGAVLLTALFIARIPLEERVLRDGLPEYGAYQSQVRYRLIPMVW